MQLFGPTRMMVLALLAIQTSGCQRRVQQDADGRPDPAPITDVMPTPISLIPPGTVIADRAPESWTHLVVKSRPRVASGAVDQLSRYEIQSASLLGTAFLAKVSPQSSSEDPLFWLEKAAVGCFTSIGGADTIISPATHGQLGARLDLLQQLVLREFYREQQQTMQVARSATMMLIDTPVVFHYEGENRAMVIRYALLVEAQTGAMETLAWLVELDARGKYVQAVGEIQWLPANKIEDSRLFVDRGRYLLGVPTALAFGVEDIPRGEIEFAIPQEIRTTLASKRLTEIQIATMERSLHHILAEAAPGPASDDP